MRIAVIVSVVILLGAIAVSALEVPATKGYVTDYAGLLSSSEAQQLDAKLRAYDRQTSKQVVVLIVRSLAGETIESFGIKVANKWKPGQKGKDNGVILIIAKDDHKTRIEVGYGLEPVLTDAQCALILDKIVKPEFRAGNYYAGINAAVDVISKAISGELIIPQDNQVGQTENSRSGSILFALLMVIVIILVFIGNYYRATSSMWIGGGFLGSSSRSGFGGGGGWSGGGGFSGGGGGGGFSGGGGGFGGGGASGSW